MNSYTVHRSECSCQHNAETGDQYADCDYCACLPEQGQCLWSDTWGDQYAGGIDHCGGRGIGNSDHCARHGGSWSGVIIRKLRAIALRSLECNLDSAQRRALRSEIHDLLGRLA